MIEERCGINMKNGNKELKETIKPSVSEQIEVKLKELNKAPKDTASKITAERVAKKKEADEIAIQQLAKQKDAPVSALRSSETERSNTSNRDFKHKLDPKLNKGSDISFGASGCEGFCKKKRDSTSVHGTYYV